MTVEPASHPDLGPAPAVLSLELSGFAQSVTFITQIQKNPLKCDRCHFENSLNELQVRNSPAGGIPTGGCHDQANNYG